MTGRVCIFVDAGYLFKQGSGAVLSEKLGRHEIVLDAQKFISELAEWLATCYPGDEVLRTYWYDGAKQGIPSTDQLTVAALSFVKLRLGRINSSGQQKGVDGVADIGERADLPPCPEDRNRIAAQGSDDKARQHDSNQNPTR